MINSVGATRNGQSLRFAKAHIKVYWAVFTSIMSGVGCDTRTPMICVGRLISPSTICHLGGMKRGESR